MQPPTGKQQGKRKHRGPELTLNLGDRQFSGTLEQPAFLVVRLERDRFKSARNTTIAKELDRVVLTPLAPEDKTWQSVSAVREAAAASRRSPGAATRLRQHLRSGRADRRPSQATSSAKYVFEGTIENFPAPIVEKDNVNYLAGIHEIARPQRVHGRP